MNQPFENLPEKSTAKCYPHRATTWKLRTREIQFPELPLLMGIVNVTPDSFSDGGMFSDTEAAVLQALKLVQQGAAILDIGGESTRPYSDPVSVEEELSRVIPVIQQLHEQTTVPISIDTSKAKVAATAIAAGAEIINDITALTGDKNMVNIAVKSGAAVCAMHMQGTPQTMQNEPQYQDVVEEVYRYLNQRKESLIDCGIEAKKICLDPGIGFGKSHQHNLTLLQNASRFHQLQCPVLIGHSRKGFIAKLIGDQEGDRTSGTIGIALSLAIQGVQIIRVHDVQPIREAQLLFAASGGLSQVNN